MANLHVPERPHLAYGVEAGIYLIEAMDKGERPEVILGVLASIMEISDAYDEKRSCQVDMPCGDVAPGSGLPCALAANHEFLFPAHIALDAQCNIARVWQLPKRHVSRFEKYCEEGRRRGEPASRAPTDMQLGYALKALIHLLSHIAEGKLPAKHDPMWLVDRAHSILEWHWAADPAVGDFRCVARHAEEPQRCSLAFGHKGWVHVALRPHPTAPAVLARWETPPN